MSVEIAIIAGSSVAGAISAAFIERLARSRDNKHPRPSNTARTELLSLLFEKNLAGQAITRVYEAFKEGSIDRLQRDRLLLKYKKQLDSLDQKIEQLQPVADYGDMTELRNNLVSILENKISALDQKLLAIKPPGVSDEIDARVQKIIAEVSKTQTTTIEEKSFKVEEKTVDQLQKEIMHALQRLEQVELDKD